MVAYGNVSLGITGSIAGLAESGSVVLDHAQGQPRLASLVPETHVVLLEISTIERTLAHWAARHPDLVPASANLVIVTGPSRTGDIEQILNLGVHGPRHLHVVLIR
jgi:L-lactate dehydrogenase complex protein LldG